ncbi:MAG: hypothetical protein Kow0025_21400 [Thermodesulfovibrionales bacterium]
MRLSAALALFLALAAPAAAFMDEAGIGSLQRGWAALPVGERIALWAERFLGTPYDTDPLGEYVTRRSVVADERVDCMYLTFRAVELALASTPAEAVSVALDKRFRTRGALAEDGRVANYGDRFIYAADMLSSGKWGREITSSLGRTVEMPGPRGEGLFPVLPAGEIGPAVALLESGDIVFFVKDPSKRAVGEMVGHMGIIKREGGDVYLIHASGRKKLGGSVKKELFADYAGSMPFAGIMVSRF